jgi:hypothetical protein
MVKTFLIFIILQIFLHAHEQIVLVVADDINSSRALLWCLEDKKVIFKPIKVNLGKNGLGIGLGINSYKYRKNDILKYEGDKRAPVGIFKLTHIFGYKKQNNFKMPYLYANKDLICVDDSKHNNYNQIIPMPDSKPNSFEYMKRDDLQYELGIVVEHNKAQIPLRGSCIFIHVQKAQNSPTAGCTSMKYKELEKILNWLNIDFNPKLIQTTKKRLSPIYKKLLNI